MKSWNQDVYRLWEIRMRSTEPRVVIFYGPSGMGKTAAGKIFCKLYGGYYFSFRNMEASLALHLFEPDRKNWEDFFDALRTKEKRPVIFFDDVDDRNDKDDFLNALYSRIDQNLFVVLCCRKPMELQCKTSSLPVEPMSVANVQSVIQCTDRLDTLRIFALTGGIPELVYQYDDMLPFLENMRQFFTLGSRYLTYAERRMHQEFRSPESYSTLLFGIAQGCHRISQLAEFSGFPKNKVDKYLKALMDAGLIVTRSRSCADSQQRTHYFFRNSYWEIWYRFYFPVQWRYGNGVPDDVLQSWMTEIEQSFVISYYQDLCLRWFRETAIKERILNDFAFQTKHRKQISGIIFDYCESTQNYTAFVYIWPSLTEPFPKELYERIISVTTKIQPYYKNQYFLFSAQPLPRFLVTERERNPNVHATDLRGLIWSER